VARPHGGATGLSRFIDFIDENGSGPGGAATRAASAKTVGLLASRCTPKITQRTHLVGRWTHGCHAKIQPREYGRARHCESPLVYEAHAMGPGRTQSRCQ
jgi:hypothetical protein